MVEDDVEGINGSEFKFGEGEKLLCHIKITVSRSKMVM